MVQAGVHLAPSPASWLRASSVLPQDLPQVAGRAVEKGAPFAVGGGGKGGAGGGRGRNLAKASKVSAGWPKYILWRYLVVSVVWGGLRRGPGYAVDQSAAWSWRDYEGRLTEILSAPVWRDARAALPDALEGPYGWGQVGCA